MSDNEYIDLNEFEEGNFFDINFDSIDQQEIGLQNDKAPGRFHHQSARHRIEDYFEIKRLREQISDPVYNL